eukprot:TRINITY_DN13037_c0_g3_i1.p1 TRINITY_DN13037_c0_g3~~TRINITY_DN13037_c0_g3_i1.p1  ORF type:complete len:276 (+),score=33.47 TRINITY_DN13037_c0_g3_i1:158-985(+)
MHLLKMKEDMWLKATERGKKIISEYQRANTGEIKRSNKQDFIVKEEEGAQRNGRWTSEEKQHFVEALHIYGKDWKKVQAYVGTRTGTQVRSHAQKHFLKTKKKGATEGSSESQTQIIVMGREFKTEHNLPPPAIDSDIAKIRELKLRTDLILSHSKASLANSVSVKSDLPLLRNKLFEILHIACKLLPSVRSELAQDCTELARVISIELSNIEARIKHTMETEAEVREAAMERNCKYLVKHMMNFGLRNLKEIGRKYVKLSDWVNTNYAGVEILI